MKNLNLCLFLLTIFMSISCSRDEEPDTKSVTNLNTAQTYIINGGIEYVSEKNDGSQISSKPKFIYDIPKINNSTNHVNNITSKTAEKSISIDFGFPGYPLGNPTNSGCTMSWYNHSSGTSTTSDKGVYGSNPALSTYNPNDKPYLVRGFSLPHQNYYYGSLVLHVSNKGKKSNTRRGEWHSNESRGAAISIEYPFKANISYEITLKVAFHDNRFLIDKAYSVGFPTIYAQLKNDGIIDINGIRRGQINDPCSKIGTVNLADDSYNYQNYTRSYTLDSRAVIWRNVVFKFSPTVYKNALLISLHPATSPEGYGAPIETNNYTMVLPLVTITEKPFDPSLNVPDPVYTPRGEGGGRR